MSKIKITVRQNKRDLKYLIYTCIVYKFMRKKIKTVHDFGHFYATLELERCINAVIDCFSFFF